MHGTTYTANTDILTNNVKLNAAKSTNMNNLKVALVSNIRINSLNQRLQYHQSKEVLQDIRNIHCTICYFFPLSQWVNEI
jgi:hypothetical protein